MSSRITVAERLAATNNRPSGFDYMRLLLATAVIAQHSHALSYGGDAVDELFLSPARPVIAVILPLFFALSGFLVAGSLERSATLINFLGLRVLRIVPALAVEITLSALILGPLFTITLPGTYFTDPAFASYFLNIVGDIHYYLPGVFLNNPVPEVVNGQLWTIPVELYCYIALAGIAFVGLAAKKRVLLTFIVLAEVLFISVKMDTSLPVTPAVRGYVLLLCFLAGVALFSWRDKLPWSPALFAVCAAVSVALLLIPGADAFVAFPIAYMAVYLGFLNPPRSSILLKGDYSYGLYLYGYPIQQAVASFGPLNEWYWNFSIAMALAGFIAVGSWWCVEKPALNLRRFLPRIEAVALRNPLIAWHSRLMCQGIEVLWRPIAALRRAPILTREQGPRLRALRRLFKRAEGRGVR